MWGLTGIFCILWQLENFKDEKPHKKNTYNSNLGIIGAIETNGLTAALELQKQVALSLSNWRFYYLQLLEFYGELYLMKRINE